MRTYSTREVTELLGIRSERVRSYARQGIVTSTRNAHGHYRFSFQDLVLLRTANELVKAKLGPHRVWRALRAVRNQLPDGRPLSSVRVFAEADRVIVRERNTAWEPESGQTILNFAVDVNCQIVCLLSINPFSDMMACYLIFVPIHVFLKTLDFNV